MPGKEQVRKSRALTCRGPGRQGEREGREEREDREGREETEGREGREEREGREGSSRRQRKLPGQTVTLESSFKH